MGICQSAALKVVVYDVQNNTKQYTFSMKKMRTFETMGDVFSCVNVDLTPRDRIYARSHVGLEEIPTYARFQIRDLIIKDGQRVIKYRVAMSSMY